MYSAFQGKRARRPAYSTEGYNWKALNGDISFLKPVVIKDKLMRDLNIIKGADGLYHMVWTVSWTDKGMGPILGPLLGMLPLGLGAARLLMHNVKSK